MHVYSKYILPALSMVMIFACSCEKDRTQGIMEQPSGHIELISKQDSLLKGMHFYFGNLHAHTRYSDGTGTPGAGYAWARDIAKFDYYAITDHCELLSEAEWSDIGSNANAYNVDGVFVAIRGFEWSSTISGHLNIFGTAGFPGLLNTLFLSGIFGWIDNNNAIAQFNHPEYTDNSYNDFRLTGSVIDNMCLLESGNGELGNNNNRYLPQYQKALDKGWKVAPANNQDNHSLSLNSHRTVIIAPSLTRDDLFEAIKARRVYSTDDSNIRIIFKLDDLWMGSDTSVSGIVRFTADVADDEPAAKLQIISGGGFIAAQVNIPEDATSVNWSPEIYNSRSSFFYLRVISINIEDEDSPIQVSVTAPIWIR